MRLKPCYLVATPAFFLVWYIVLNGSESPTRCLDAPIDAVYTWVNGSDQEYLDVIEKQADLRGKFVFDQRIHDWGTMRYSLRSLQMYAPWVRNIYIVTSGQVPQWLKLRSGIQVVTHNEIFEDKTLLPTFNTWAIYTQLIRIPGLSEKFLLFDDDMFFGQPVSKKDFCYGENGQKFYVDWDVEYCAVGCPSSSVGDGTCNRICNVSACLYDKGDCSNPNVKVDEKLGYNYTEIWTYSLHFVNQIFNNVYGYTKSRPYISHQTNLLDKTVIKAFLSKFQEFARNTSERRFRNKYDCQLDFAYSNFLYEETFDQLKKAGMVANVDCMTTDCTDLKNDTMTRIANKKWLSGSKYNHQLISIEDDDSLLLVITNDYEAKEKEFSEYYYGKMAKFVSLNDYTDEPDDETAKKVQAVVDKFLNRVFPIKSKFEKD